jgi:rhamnose utilization protein RhaD (predicted bifunctional aldolase and dehydrogenase)
MKRLMLLMPVLIVAIAVFMFATTEQGATIRADVRKRVAQAIDNAKAMAQNSEDVAVDVATVEVETVSV